MGHSYRLVKVESSKAFKRAAPIQNLLELQNKRNITLMCCDINHSFGLKGQHRTKGYKALWRLKEWLPATGT